MKNAEDKLGKWEVSQIEEDLRMELPIHEALLKINQKNRYNSYAQAHARDD